MRLLVVRFVLAYLPVYLTALSRAERCPVHFKPEKDGQHTSTQCVSITSLDPLLALNWLTTEDTTINHGVVDTKEVRNKSHRCRIWSIRKQRIPNKCDRIDFSFEMSWVNAGCEVSLTYSSYKFKCSQQVSRVASKLGFEFSSSLSNEPPRGVHLLRVHDNHKGSMPALLSEVYLQTKLVSSILQHIPVLSLDLVLHPAALQDTGAGDSSAHAWQLWSAATLLQAEMFTVSRVTPHIPADEEKDDAKNDDFKDKPLQYAGEFNHLWS